MAAGAGAWWSRHQLTGPSPTVTAPSPVAGEPASYVGGAACASCHQPEVERWRGSHHDRAMQVADSTTVLGNFDNATFRYAGFETRFSRRDGKYIVST